MMASPSPVPGPSTAFGPCNRKGTVGELAAYARGRSFRTRGLRSTTYLPTMQHGSMLAFGLTGASFKTTISSAGTTETPYPTASKSFKMAYLRPN